MIAVGAYLQAVTTVRTRDPGPISNLHLELNNRCPDLDIKVIIHPEIWDQYILCTVLISSEKLGISRRVWISMHSRVKAQLMSTKQSLVYGQGLVKNQG